ncbi:MAG: tyrosine-type recombinase/integrase [Cyclobacteriaceae bacterium]|nr:tyrosine-type recombinase/integrase [Cyclobacteriaceae bacterium]
MIEKFLKYLEYEKRYSKHTVISYHSDLDQFSHFISLHYPDQSLVDVDYRILRSWILSLVDDKIKNTSINRKIASLRSFYKFLLKREQISENPTWKLRVLKKSKKLPQFVNEDDMIILLDQTIYSDGFTGLRDKLIMEMLYGTGIRLAELMSLQEKDINFHNQTIKVVGKRNKERIIPFSNNLENAIRKYQKEKPSKSNYLLTTDTGEQLYPMFVYRVVKKYLSLVNVDKRSPHVLRHTYATHLLNKGAELNAVKDLLGHTSLAATQVYTHNSIEKLKSVYKKAHPKA